MPRKLNLVHLLYLLITILCFGIIYMVHANHAAAALPEITPAANAAAAAAEAPPTDAFDAANIDILPNYKKVRKNVGVASVSSQQFVGEDEEASTIKKLKIFATKGKEKIATTNVAAAAPARMPKDTSVKPDKVIDVVKTRGVQKNPQSIDKVDEVVVASNNKQRVPDDYLDNKNIINNNNKNNVKIENELERQAREANEKIENAVAAEELVPNSKQKPVISDNLVDKHEELQHQQQQQQQGDGGEQTAAASTAAPNERLPEIITEIPTVTVPGGMPLELVETAYIAAGGSGAGATGDSNMETLINESNSAEQTEHLNRTVDIFEHSNEVVQKDEQVLQINDPGGGAATVTTTADSAELSSAEVNIPTTPNDTAAQHQNEEPPSINDTATATQTVPTETSNASSIPQPAQQVEEVPIPVFSEWAQKQMEAEASKQALEQEQQLVVNNSAQRRNNTNSNGKPQVLKVRAKNYASPDCGAKIIASNQDARNTGAVLTNSRDEYMLSPCGNRIWFIVELCEAIQAQKIELANFELFSSSPRNFTVAVSNRFPTRDWSNVGRFTAEDKRNVQTFELHPHLFGKFVRVDIHSHYSKEHFCPVSLFRVFGTSEFEAFETEIRSNDDLDDFDDEQEEQAYAASADNIFKSASDAVIQMVKKAAEVLVKPTTHALRRNDESQVCRTPAFEQFSCPECNNTIVERINTLLSCEFQNLQALLRVPQLTVHLLQTRYCANDFGIKLTPPLTQAPHISHSYFLSMLPSEYVGALCKLLADQQSYVLRRKYANSTLLQPKTDGVAAHDLKHLGNAAELQNDTNACDQTTGDSQTAAEHAHLENAKREAVPDQKIKSEVNTQPTEASINAEKIAGLDSKEVSSSAEITPPTAPDVNIFNVPAAETANDHNNNNNKPTPATAGGDASVEELSTTAIPPQAPTPLPAPETGGATPQARSDEDANNWESIDNLLTTTVASITAGGAAVAGAGALNVNTPTSSSTSTPSSAVNMQQKLPNGAQSESVFIRLSNRIKALERNMSLSGQYLEELSRRYKKQVEELQQTLTQQTLTVRTLEEQSRRYIEQEQVYQQHTSELSGEVRSLTLQVQACIVVIIFVGACIFLMLIFGSVYYRKLRRQTQELVLINAAGRDKAAGEPIQPQEQRKMRRRKSYEDFPIEQTHCTLEKLRRPSEEAMLILKDCDTTTTTTTPTTPDVAADTVSSSVNRRQRKMSICYGSNNNINAGLVAGKNVAGNNKRKGVKHSWHGGQDFDKFFDIDTLSSTPTSKASPAYQNGEQQQAKQHGKSKKKSQQQQQQQLLLKRQESAPSTLNNHSTVAAEAHASDFDESLMLDDEDLVNFLPTNDLAYNEFMPEGPSGYQIIANNSESAIKNQEKTTNKKFRRLSSPAFFKSPFGKNKIKNSLSSASVKVKHQNSVHEPTSWEWYRLRRNEQKQQQQLDKRQHQQQSPSTPSASLDSSSLSEINFPTNSTRNSFRILEEAILSSGEIAAIRNSNGNAQSSGASSSSGSCSVGNRDSGGSHGSASSSTTSSTTKKKSRAFNRIFRNVF